MPDKTCVSPRRCRMGVSERLGNWRGNGVSGACVAYHQKPIIRPLLHQWSFWSIRRLSCITYCTACAVHTHHILTPFMIYDNICDAPCPASLMECASFHIVLQDTIHITNINLFGVGCCGPLGFAVQNPALSRQQSHLNSTTPHVHHRNMNNTQSEAENAGDSAANGFAPRAACDEPHRLAGGALTTHPPAHHQRPLQDLANAALARPDRSI